MLAACDIEAPFGANKAIQHITWLGTLEGFFGRLKVEFFHGRDWRGVSAERFAAELAEWIRWYREGRLKAFDEGGRKVYDTIAGRRRRLGLAA